MQKLRHQVFVPLELMSSFPGIRLFRRKECFGWYVLPVKASWVIVSNETAYVLTIQDPKVTNEMVEEMIISFMEGYTDEDDDLRRLGLEPKRITWHAHLRIPSHVEQRYRQVKKLLAKGVTSDTWLDIDDLNVEEIEVIGFKISPLYAMGGIVTELIAQVKQAESAAWWRRLLPWR